MRKYYGKVSRSGRANIYLVRTCQVQARSSIAGSSASIVDGQCTDKSILFN